MYDAGILWCRLTGIIKRHSLKRMDSVQPSARRVSTKRILIRQSVAIAACIPFFAVHSTGVTADTDIKIDYQPQLFWWFYR